MVHRLEARIAFRKVEAGEHVEARPGLRGLGAAELQELREAQAGEPHAEGGKPGCAGQGGKDRAGTEGADDFVVADVEHDHVGPADPEIAGDVDEDGRIDGGHGGVDDFIAVFAVHFAEQFFEQAGRAEFQQGVALGGGFAQHGDADESRGLVAFDGDGGGVAREFGGEEAIAVERIVHPGGFTCDGCGPEEGNGPADVRQPQGAFEEGQREERRKEGQGEFRGEGFSAGHGAGSCGFAVVLAGRPRRARALSRFRRASAWSGRSRSTASKWGMASDQR